MSEFTTVKNKLTFKCKCTEIHESTFEAFRKHNQCKNCSNKELHDNLRHDINYVKQFFIDNNCIPLFDEYKNTKTLLKYQCSCGNISKITFDDLRNGGRCKKCSIERRLKTKYIINNAPTSLQQNYLHNLYGGEINYPEGNSSLDIAFPDNKIYIEYDGSGHDLSVKLNSITLEEFNEKEKRRNYALYRRGWKEIRIKSKKDNLPSDITLLQMYNDALEILKISSFVVYDIDNKTIKYKNNILNYNYGELKRLRNDYVS